MERIAQGTCTDRDAAGRRRILLVRLDAIGDYVLFRNHLRSFRESERFRDAHLTILGNPAWRSLAETFDADCADRWWWLSDPGRYFKKGRENLLPAPIWKRRIRSEQDALRSILAEEAFDCVISTRIDRDPLLDRLLAGTAPERIGAKGPGPSAGDCSYTSLLDADDGPFIFDRNRSFMTALTGERPDVRLHLEIPGDRRQTKGKGAIILCIGASHWTRRLPCVKLARICEALLAKTPFEIIVTGGNDDRGRAGKILDFLGAPSRVRTTTAFTTLSDFARMAATAACVISHDTGPMHIAAAVGAPVVGICNGYSGKDAFWPYPDGRVRMCLPSPPLPPLPRFLPLAQLQSAKAIRSIPVDSIVDEVLQAIR